MIQNKTTAVTAFGTRNEIREMTERIKVMLPGGSKLSINEMRALAQASVAHGLDPFNGEIWFLKDKDGNPRGLMIGVKGLRKKAHEQVRGNFWIEFREIADQDERTRLSIADGALAFEARLFDSENVRTYAETVERLMKAGIPWEAVCQMVGARPYTSGIGVLRANEQTRMERAQCAMKRAEADALKRRFDVPFGLVADVDAEAEVESFSGEWDSETFDAAEMEQEIIEPESVKCTCGHFIEQHGIKLACEAEGCACRKFADAALQDKLAANKKKLGRDGGGLD